MITNAMAGKAPTPKQRRFCQALHEVNGGEMRWATIMSIAARLKMDVRVAVVLSADRAAAGLVQLDVKGTALSPAAKFGQTD